MFKLNLLAPINDLGYGIHARGIITGLGRLGYDNYFLSYIGGQRTGELSEEEIKLTNKLVKTPWDRSAPCVKIWHETQMNDLSGSKLIAYPVWETTKLVPKAIHDLRQMDAIFVTTSWGKKIMEENLSNNVPVYVVNEAGQEFNEGIDLNKEKFPVFTFLHVGKYEMRKCTAEIIQSYVEVFADRKDETRLIVHCFNPFDRYFTRTMCNMFKALDIQLISNAADETRMIAIKGNAIVEIPRNKLSKTELQQLYLKSHVGVYPSRGEGWNLDLFEGITMNLPSIASFVAGHTEYTTEELGYPQDLLLFNGREEPAYDGVWFRDYNKGNWISPDLEELKEKMDYAYTNYGNIMQRFDPSLIKDKFTWENSARQMLTALDDITDGEMGLGEVII